MAAEVTAPEQTVDTVRIVCISDTHGQHRSLDPLPEGDILVHAGDYTHFGKETDANDFNEWLGSQPHPHKIVVNGNHEVHAGWQSKKATTVNNATYLNWNSVDIDLPGKPRAVNIYGTDFFWPEHPDKRLSKIPKSNSAGRGGCDILVTHGPPLGKVDGGGGSAALFDAIQQVRPLVVVSGHVHGAHGVEISDGITYVNAAICGANVYKRGHDAVIVDMRLPVSQAATQPNAATTYNVAAANH